MKTWTVLDPLPFRRWDWKLKDPPKPKTWEEHDEAREEYFIDKLGPLLWAWLGQPQEIKRVKLSDKCPVCGSYQGQYHSPECKKVTHG